MWRNERPGLAGLSRLFLRWRWSSVGGGQSPDRMHRLSSPQHRIGSSLAPQSIPQKACCRDGSWRQWSVLPTGCRQDRWFPVPVLVVRYGSPARFNRDDPAFPTIRRPLLTYSLRRLPLAYGSPHGGTVRAVLEEKKGGEQGILTAIGYIDCLPRNIVSEAAWPPVYSPEGLLP